MFDILSLYQQLPHGVPYRCVREIVSVAGKCNHFLAKLNFESCSPFLRGINIPAAVIVEACAQVGALVEVSRTDINQCMDGLVVKTDKLEVERDYFKLTEKAELDCFIDVMPNRGFQVEAQLFADKKLIAKTTTLVMYFQ